MNSFTSTQRSDQAVVQPHSQQADAPCVLSIIANINLFSNMCNSSSSMGSDQMGYPLLPCHWFTSCPTLDCFWWELTTAY